MKKILTLITLIICSQLILIKEIKAQSNVVRQVIVSETNMPILVNLAEGYGVNISFNSGEEIIEKVWLDNPSFVTLDVDGCLSGLGDNNCQESNASVIHLRRIQPLLIEGLPQTNSSLMTVITRTVSNSNNLYLFTINRASFAQELVIEVRQNPPTPQVIIQRPIVNYRLIEAIERGIRSALRDDLLYFDSELNDRLKRFINLLKEGVSVEVAAESVNISLDLVEKLKQLGNYQNYE